MYLEDEEMAIIRLGKEIKLFVKLKTIQLFIQNNTGTK